MKHFIRDNSKKLLAVLGVILMVAFILPSQNRLGDRSSQYLVGHMGDQKVYDGDIKRAKQQWEFLEQVIVISPEMVNNQVVPVVNAYRQNPAFNILATQITNHPETFYLLQQEAERNGIVVLPGDMDEEFKRRHFAVRLPSGVVCALEDVTDPQYAAAIRDAAAALTRVERSLNRAVMAMKVSKPLREHQTAQQLQQVQLEVAEFSANDLLTQVPAPTADDLKKQFDTFAEYLPDSASSAQNPHGFGYKYPNRVTLQYLGVRQGDVHAAVLGTKTKYDWDVEAQKYYQKNLPKYQTTQPTTVPATQPGMASTQPTGGKTTKPFADVRDEIVETLMAPEISRKARDLQDRINTKLSRRLRHVAREQSEPAIVAGHHARIDHAAAGNAGDFTSFEYLHKLAADMQQQTGVLPQIVSVNQYQTAKDLQSMDGIGLAMANQIPFSAYATEFAAPFVPEAERSKTIVLQLYKPSQVLRDAAGSSYVFRVTGALPSAKPSSIDEVVDAVSRDWKIAKAYELASTRAEDLLTAARKSSLLTAATEAKVKSVTTGVFDQTSPAIDRVNLTGEPMNKFRFDAFNLLATAATQPTSPPLELIQLPVQAKVYVAQLLSSKPRIDTTALPMIDAMVETELLTQMSEPIIRSWYDFNQVALRTAWKDEQEKKKTSG